MTYDHWITICTLRTPGFKTIDHLGHQLYILDSEFKPIDHLGYHL